MLNNERCSPQETNSAFALILSVFVFIFSRLIYPIIFGFFSSLCSSELSVV